MAGTTDPLQKGRDAPRGSDLADEFDGPHVDPEFKRCRRDQRTQTAFAQRGLDPQTPVAR